MWKPVADVFHGGTQAVIDLKGKRVRNRGTLLGANVHDPASRTPSTMDVPAGSTGFVANPLGSEVLIAYPGTPQLASLSLDALSRSKELKVIQVNWSTFRHQFEIEM